MLDKLQKYIFRCQECLEPTTADFSVFFYNEEALAWRIVCDECLPVVPCVMAEFERALGGFMLAEVKASEELILLFRESLPFEGRMNLYFDLLKLIYRYEKPNL